MRAKLHVRLKWKIDQNLILICYSTKYLLPNLFARILINASLMLPIKAGLVPCS